MLGEAYTQTLQPREETLVKKQNVDLLNTGSMEQFWSFIDNTLLGTVESKQALHLMRQSFQPWCVSGVH